MPDPTNSNFTRHRFSTRRLLAIVAAAAVGFIPMACFGWQGIISTICLVVSGILFVTGRRGFAAALVVILLLGQVFYPVMDGAREASLRTDCQNNIQQLTTAIHEYESKHGHIPPPYSTAADGTPLHSWRVLLLPFLGEQTLYDQIETNKPWNDPANVQFHNRMPDIYCCAAVKYHSKWRSVGSTTGYIVVVGPKTAWHPNTPPSLTQISNADGTSATIAIVESENHRIPWMSINDPELTAFIESIDFSRPHNGLLNFSMFDASANVLSNSLEPQQISRMLIMDDGD